MFASTTIMGNLGADPEMRYTANGSAVATFRVATSRRYTKNDGEKAEETTWYRCVAWGRTAEVAAQYLQKGRSVLIEGRMSERSWDDQQGQKRYSWELVVGRLVLMPDGRSRREYAGAGEFDQGGGGHLVEGALAAGASRFGDGEGDIDPDDLPF